MNLLAALLSGIAIATALWLLYRGLLSGRADWRLARPFLLASVLAVPLLPLYRELAPVTVTPLQLAVDLPEIVVGTPSNSELPVASLLIAGYCIIAVCLLGVQLIGALRLLRRLRNGRTLRKGSYTLQFETGVGPGTIGRRIFLPEASADRSVIDHELGHIRAGHRYDLLLVNLVCCLFWINPALWMLRRELRLVHEFEADQYAVSSTGDSEAYARLLLRHVMGGSSGSFCHAFFHHPIKQRIAMLFANKPSRAAQLRRTLSLSLTAGVVLAAALFVRCKPEPAPEPLTVSFEQPEQTQLPSGVLTHAEKMPAFSGDMAAYLAGELRYPEAARTAGTQGRSILQFVVTAAGKVENVRVVKSSGSEALDEEALRVVRAMPDWQPGMNGGKAASVLFTLPISFKLDDAPVKDTRTGQATGTFSSPGLPDQPLTVTFSQS